MEKRVKKIKKERKNFSGVFQGDYIENDFFGNQIRKIIFCNIVDIKGNLIKEKQEFVYSSDFVKNNLTIGDVVEFNARITHKPKGYLGSRKHIKHDVLEINLMRPTKILKK